MEQTERRVYTVKELKPILKASANHIYNMIARGELPAVRLGRKIVVPAHMLERFLDGTWQPRKN